MSSFLYFTLRHFIIISRQTTSISFYLKFSQIWNRNLNFNSIPYHNCHNDIFTYKNLTYVLLDKSNKEVGIYWQDLHPSINAGCHINKINWQLCLCHVQHIFNHALKLFNDWSDVFDRTKLIILKYLLLTLFILKAFCF